MADEHIEKIKHAIDMQKIVFRGETLDQEKAVAGDIFYMFHGRDEREPM